MAALRNPALEQAHNGSAVALGYAKKINIRSVFRDTRPKGPRLLRELVELFILLLYNLFFGVALKVCQNASQAARSPRCRPAFSAACRCVDEPWVQDSGET